MSTGDVILSERKKKRVLDNYSVRLMTENNIPQCQDIFKEHGFPPLTGCIKTLLTIDLKGCFVVVSNDRNGKEIILALCISSKYDLFHSLHSLE